MTDYAVISGFFHDDNGVFCLSKGLRNGIGTTGKPALLVSQDREEEKAAACFHVKRETKCMDAYPHWASVKY